MTASYSAQIGFGRIRHTRLRPAVHRLNVGGFFLRLPLRSLQQVAWPASWLVRNRAGLFALNDQDHGDGRPLLEWISHLLSQAGIDDVDGEIWLHTFPRVLGYVFNPVSFWFCERADGTLRAVVCEVNNTFGERHCYLLAHADRRSIHWGEELTAVKEFHVSPFCEVRGRYRFRFLLSNGKLLDPTPRFISRIDYDDPQGALLQTSVEGRLVPLTNATLRRVLWRYPAYTAGVMLRIHWHAARLWLKRVPFFSKPRPPQAAVTRSTSR